MTGPQANLSSAQLHVDGANIYAIVGQKICYSNTGADGFNNVATNVDAPITSFEAVAANEFHAVIGRKICKWSGVAWDPITDDSPNLLGELELVGNGYATATLDGEVAIWR